jgi:hypothetical protein
LLAQPWAIRDGSVKDIGRVAIIEDSLNAKFRTLPSIVAISDVTGYMTPTDTISAIVTIANVSLYFSMQINTVLGTLYAALGLRFKKINR